MVSRASAFNNVVQRTSAALGLAVLTAMVDRSQAQLAADRAALLGPGTDLPVLGSGPTGQLAGMYATYQQLQTQVFVEAMDGLFMVTAVITAVGIGLAFLLRSGPAPKAPRAPRRGTVEIVITATTRPSEVSRAPRRLYWSSRPRHLQRRRVAPCVPHARSSGRARSTSRCSWCCSPAHAGDACGWLVAGPARRLWSLLRCTAAACSAGGHGST